MDKMELKNYLETVIPNIEKELTKEKDTTKLMELYSLYEDVLQLVSPYDFSTYNKFLEFEEDKTQPNRGFHHHRKYHMKDVYQSLNDMEMENKYDILLISLPPRTGKTTYGIRFLSWIIGKYPEYTQLATSYSDAITSSFYTGVMEIVMSDRYTKVFPQSMLMNQNAKKQEIWLKVLKRYPSIAFIPVGGSPTGRAEANNYLYVDDIVSGMEEALSPTRLDKLWSIFSGNFYQRRKEGCKMVIIATRWSVHDPMTIIERMYEGNPRFKNVKLSAYDEYGESNFNYPGGFTTDYYKDIEKSIDPLSFNALYRQEPIEREGLLYHEDELQYYFDLPNEEPDAIIAVCDSKNLGKDYVSSPLGYVYGDLIYLEDVVYDNGLPETTVPKVAKMWYDHNATRGDLEMNNGGNYYAEGVDKEIKRLGGNTSVRMFFTGNNKNVKIITYSDFVKKNIIFKDKSKYSSHSDYAKFMSDVFKWTQTGKNHHDDSVDSLAMLAQLVQDLQGNSVKILDRRKLGI